MCGICGYWQKENNSGKGLELLNRMCRLQEHRGPDDMAVLQRNNVGLGFVRLAILDLATGMQPVTSPSDDTAIVCNGQIYNYIELKQELPAFKYTTSGDMEVALNAYRHFGLDFPAKLNGMFAGAIHDPSENRLVLFRDRFGIKPLYYTQNETGFYFSSEIKPLLETPGTHCELDMGLLSTWFTYRYVPGENTLFKGIRKLPPGSVLVLNTKNGDFTTGSYWNWNFSACSESLSAAEAEEEFNRLFTDSVKLRLRSDVEVGSLISGGIDSSAVASLAALQKPDLKLFTIGFQEEKYDETDDVNSFLSSMQGRFARAEPIQRVCARKRLDLLPEIIRAVEEPISLGTVVPTDQVCWLASEHLKVVLTGEGADEIFAGYRKFLVEEAALEFPGASSSMQRELLRLYPELELRLGGADDDPARRHIASEKLFTSSELARLLGNSSTAEADISAWLPKRVFNAPDPVAAMQMIEVETRLPHYVNLRLDKISMRHSLETRTPFLDYRLAELAGKLPVKLRVNLETGREKYICRNSFMKRGILPPEAALRTKKPFTMPIADWFSEPETLPEPVKDILLGKAVDRQGILDGNMVREYAGLVTGAGVGPETMISAGDRVFAVVVFTLWYEEFMKGSV
ncbi:asparagine synthase (glutamine-hydrolyzing) [Candidatus Fermentibacteria bacterium]|nr:MAG: asparagine synthase (glutamine-hydrolyzing) [Candidatus Fermentibacteria bacterium]